MSRLDSSTIGALQAAAYIVIVAWGIKAASHILSVILISLLLAYVILPFPKWLIRRFHFRKNWAIALTLLLVMGIYLVLSVLLVETTFHIRAKLPVYEQHFSSLSARIIAFLSARGIESVTFSFKSLYSPERFIEFVSMILPYLIGFFSDRVIVWLLSLIFLMEMAEADEAEGGLLGRNLVQYGKDIQRFISISAKTGAMTAAANLVILIALGVDFPVLWCFLYFLLHFIPNVGFLVSLIPPVLVALLAMGWKRALLALAGLILTQMISDYVIQPTLMKKGLHITFLQITLSLLIWGFLLGPAGAILAVPLTMALKKLIENSLTRAVAAPEPVLV